MTATFPSGVWDGRTSTRENPDVSRSPDGVDWSRCIEEVKALQIYTFGEVETLSGQEIITTPSGTNRFLCTIQGDQIFDNNGNVLLR